MKSLCNLKAECLTEITVYYTNTTLHTSMTPLICRKRDPKCDTDAGTGNMSERTTVEHPNFGSTSSLTVFSIEHNQKLYE